MLGFFEKKYPGTNALIALKAVSYFDNIDEPADQPGVIKPLPSENIKKRISEAVRFF
jgi:hypothetical protein